MTEPRDRSGTRDGASGRFGRALGSTLRARGDRARTARAAADRAPDAQLGRLRMSWTLLVGVALVVVGTVTLAPSVGVLIEQRQKVAALEAQVAEQQANVDELEGAVAQWDDPAYVEAQARDRLFYVYAGEHAYVVIDDRDPAAAADSTATTSTELVETEGDWAQMAVSSIVVAGLTDATPDELQPGGTP